jgi:hypothetical protein
MVASMAKAEMAAAADIAVAAALLAAIPRDHRGRQEVPHSRLVTTSLSIIRTGSSVEEEGEVVEPIVHQWEKRVGGEVEGRVTRTPLVEIRAQHLHLEQEAPDHTVQQEEPEVCPAQQVQVVQLALEALPVVVVVRVRQFSSTAKPSPGSAATMRRM